MLVIYLFSSLSILSSHNHNEEHHHHHHHHDLPICENLDSYSLNISDCSHASHVISSKESCAICDYFSNCKPVVLDISIKTALELVTVNEIQLFTSLYIIDANNTRNKSPPFFI
jgi:hypothetical protein